MDCSPPGSSVHGTLQARILEQVAVSLSRGSTRSKDQSCISSVSCWGRRHLPFCVASQAFCICCSWTWSTSSSRAPPSILQLCLLAVSLSSPGASPVKPPPLPKAAIFTHCVHPERICTILSHHISHWAEVASFSVSSCFKKTVNSRESFFKFHSFDFWIFIVIYLFLWLCRVFVTACGI